jgi:tetratricopeptide (TPR) repeat protein
MVENLRTQLAELDAAYDLGRARRVLPRTVGLVDAAAATAYAPVIAQAGLVVGKIQLELDQVESARGHLEDAYFTARGIADRSTASGAALYLASLTGTYTDEHVLARHWLRLAEVELDADAFDERAELADVEVSVLEREGRLDDAVATAERLLARLETECDEGCETKPATHGSLSRLYSHLGREREAERHARTQLELESALHEGDHPHRARALNTLGEVLDSTARFTESYEVLVVALQMRERMLGADHPETAITRLRLGTTLLALGRGDEAVQQAARAVEAVRTRPEPLLLAALLSELGGIHLDLKHYDEARAAYQESLEIGQRVNPGGIRIRRSRCRISRRRLGISGMLRLRSRGIGRRWRCDGSM